MNNSGEIIVISVLCAFLLFIAAFTIGGGITETRIDMMAKSQGYITVNNHTYKAISVKMNEDK
jgi:hypothetical protein